MAIVSPMSELDLRNIDLNLLVALDVLLEECHVTNSAARLNLSQPAMSRALARLRETFGDQLLVRVPNGYERTPRAEELTLPLKRALDQMHRTFASPTFDPALATDTFKVCTLDYVEVVILPAFINLVISKAPDAQIQNIRRDDYSTDEIMNGTADVSLGIMPPSLPRSCLVQALFEDSYVCVMHENHPLANRKLTLDGYLEYPHSITQQGKLQGTQIDDALERLGRTRKVAVRSPYYTSSLLAIAETNLLQTVPKRLVVSLRDKLKLVMHDLPFAIDPIVINQMWHARNNDDPSHKWFRDQILLAAQTIARIDQK